MITSTIRPRIDDLGPVGHVHNTVLPAWFQEARQEILDVFMDSNDSTAFPLMIKEYTITFHRELVLVPGVFIEVRVERIGTSSYTLHEQAYQNGHLTAESRVVYIHVGADHRPAPIPEEQKAFLTQHLVEATTDSGTV